ncbi:MAG: cation:proton antiporter [Daejeonella sp.]
MILLSSFDYSLPLQNPVIIFSIVLFIILFAPIILSKIKVPHIIGLIIAGIIIGPYGLNILRRDSSIVLFGTVGLLYIMFLAGLEIDLSEFKKNRRKIIFFGMSTFLLPFIAGTVASYYYLNYGFLSSILLASMFSTHTLVSYPIASKYGIARNRAATLTIGGTMITDILALLILAAIAGITKEEVSSLFWIQLGGFSTIFVCIVFFLLPILIRWFFKRYEDSVSQYIFVLAIVFLSAFLAEAAGLEAIIGAFFSGLILNKFIPHSSSLMNRINFVGNAIFIPFFLIGVGMLVDLTVITKGWGAFRVAAVITIVAIAGKYVAAKITQKVYKLSKEEGNLIFGLSSSHAAATLAIILVGYNIIIGETQTGEPIRLLNEDVLNGTILLILISCAVSSFVVEKASRILALASDQIEPEIKGEIPEKILVSLAYNDRVKDLVDLTIMLKPKKMEIPLFALHVIEDKNSSVNNQVAAKKILNKALLEASSTENYLIPLTRFDINATNGIIYTTREHNITDLVLGLHHNFNKEIFLGPKIENILKKINEAIYIYKPYQPLNTLKRMVVVIPPQAEQEPGFHHWFKKITVISQEADLSIQMFATDETFKDIDILKQRISYNKDISFNKFIDWDDFLALTNQLKPNDLFVVVTSRKDHKSYLPQMSKLPYYLSNYFIKNSFIILYPRQLEQGHNLEDIQQTDGGLVNALTNKAGIINLTLQRVKHFLKGK